MMGADKVEEMYRVPVAEGDRIRAGLAMQLVAASTGVTAERMSERARHAWPASRARSRMRSAVTPVEAATS